MKNLTTLTAMPEVPTGYPLDDIKLYKLNPEASQNLALNPSGERGSYYWNNGPLFTGAILSDTRAYRGSFSFYAESDGVGEKEIQYSPQFGGPPYPDSISLAGPTPITTSLYVWVQGGRVAVRVLYTMDDLSENGTFIYHELYPKNCWQRVVDTFVIPDGYTAVDVVVAIGLIGPNPSSQWYTGVEAQWWVDALQIENKSYATTYFDGDQKGFIRGQRAHYWVGMPHKSYSRRTADTNTGGVWKSIDLDSYGFTLKNLIGAGYSSPQNQYTPVALKAGSVFQRALPAPSQDFDFIGELTSSSLAGLMRNRKNLIDIFRHNKTASQQPLMLGLHYAPCNEISSCFKEVPAMFRGGLDGAIDSYFNERVSLGFTSIEGYFCRAENDSGKELIYQDLFTSVNNIMRRKPDGVWDDMSGGCDSYIHAIAEAPNGDVYIGGTFTNGGGTGADYLVKYDPITETWSVVNSATAIVGGGVYALKFDAAGMLYIGGDFTSAGGVANTGKICRYDYITDTFFAVETGVNAIVHAIEVMPDGYVYVGGNFTTAGATSADYLAKYDPITNTFAVVGSATAVNSNVYALHVGGDGTTLYLGGLFTSAGGVSGTAYIASWNGTAYAALGTGCNNAVNALEVGPDGTLYVGGSFTTFASISCSYIGAWNGTRAYSLGAGVNGQVDTMVFYDGLLYVGGQFTATGTLSFTESAAVWNGTSFTTLPVDLAYLTTASVQALEFASDGSMYIGFAATGPAALTPHVQTITNGGNASVFPRIVIRGPGKLWEIKNYTTGQSMYFNLTLLPQEYVTIDLNQTELRVFSNFRSNLIGSILPGSDFGLWNLTPGDNLISIFMNDSVYETNDAGNATKNWRIAGASAINTDDGPAGTIGRIYAQYTVAGPQASLSLYKDDGLSIVSALTGLELISATNVAINESNDSGISGVVDFNSVGSDDLDIVLEVGLMNMYWREAYLSIDSLVE